MHIRLHQSHCYRALLRIIALIITSVICIITTSNIALASTIPTRISFQNVLENKDIALGAGGDIFQDSDGFIWFGGSNALIRYDGYEFRQFDIEPDAGKTGDKIPVKNVQSIFEDSHHSLWISTRTGVLRFDSRLEKLTKAIDAPSADAKMSASNIKQVIELKSGEILICSLSGLIVVDPKTNSQTAILPDETKPNWIHSNHVYAAYQAPNGDVWLGSDAGLERVDWNTKAFTRYKPYPDKPDTVQANRVENIAADSDGSLWLATSEGLIQFEISTQKISHFSHDANNPYSLSGNTVTKLIVDSKGMLWIATDGGGLSIYDKTENKFYNNQFEAGRQGSIGSNQVRSVYEDRSGDIWVGNYPVGINFFDRSSAPISLYSRDISNSNSLSHNSVLSVKEDKSGNLWLGTDGGGLDFFDRTSGNFTHYKHDANNPDSLTSDAVLSTCIDSQGMVWAGTWGGGFMSLNPETKKIVRYPYEDRAKSNMRISTSKSLNSPHVWSIREDKKHDLWITTHTGGVSRYNQATKEYTHYTSVEGDAKSLSGNVAWISFEDSKGRIWIGTSTGLNLMDSVEGDFIRFMPDPTNPTSLSNPSVLSIFEDSKNRLWVGTDSGLNLLNLEQKNFTIYTKKNGLNDDAIRNILEDSQGNLWLTTNNGFTLFNPDTKKIKNFVRIGGRLVGGFQTGSGLIGKSGEIILGGVNGLLTVNPLALSENKIAPPIALTELKIFADTITAGGADKLLSESINHTDTIVLDYQKSMFVFGFSALNYRDSSNNQYSYRLEGFDNNWLNAGSQRSAKYTNLSAGRYVFKVRGSNNDGVWNEDGKSITIIQLPPPWKTWWAYTAYGMTLLGLFAWFVHSQKRKRQLIEEQNKLLEIKVTERTAEVRQKSKDIQSMLSNMPQGLFTIQNGCIIDPEYSAYLELIFSTTNIAGRNASELLFTDAEIGSDLLDSVNAAIFSIVGEDELNFDFNSGLLIDEYTTQIGNQQKHLALGWSPILSDGVVSKLMVCVRDVTQLKQMESEAKQQRRQMDIIGQLLGISTEKFLGFEESTNRFLRLNRDEIESHATRDENCISLLFRNMHTIKGNSRTFGFAYLSNTVHEVESVYSALRASSDAHWKREDLLSDLSRVEEGLKEYAHVFHSVLGRGENLTSDRHDGFWLSNVAIEQVRLLAREEKFDQLKEYIFRINATTLDQALIDIIASLSSIAALLGKLTPMVTIAAEGVLIKAEAQELIKDVFAHVLRNCIDHGLESAAERIQAGKDERGLIHLRTESRDQTLTIYVADDGRGLNIGKLSKIGEELGKWQLNHKPTTHEIAQLIFCSGLSTKDTVTDISGRGVGMDAVKQFVEEQNGAVSLVLKPECSVDPAFIPFELAITLPEQLFYFGEETAAPEA